MSSSSSIKIIVLISVILAVPILISAFIPIIEVTENSELFEEYELNLLPGYYTWREFEITEINMINIDFSAYKQVYAYLFTSNQFTNFQNVGDDTCIDSLKNVFSGNFDKELEEGTYYFVLSNMGDRGITIDMRGESIRNYKITIFQRGF
jgi:hypothetical protein